MRDIWETGTMLRAKPAAVTPHGRRECREKVAQALTGRHYRHIWVSRLGSAALLPTPRRPAASCLTIYAPLPPRRQRSPQRTRRTKRLGMACHPRKLLAGKYYARRGAQRERWVGRYGRQRRTRERVARRRPPRYAYVSSRKRSPARTPSRASAKTLFEMRPFRCRRTHAIPNVLAAGRVVVGRNEVVATCENRESAGMIMTLTQEKCIHEVRKL